MAFSSILRRSSSSFAPLLVCALRSQQNCHFAILPALKQMRIISSEPHLSPFLPPRSYSTKSISSEPHLSPFLPPRSYSTKRPSSDENLLRFLDSEIQHAEQTGDHDRFREAPAGFPFKIEDKPGFIMMSREYHGEQIKVEVSMPDSYSETSEDDQDYIDDKWSIPLVASVAKGNGQFIEFYCTAWLDELVIYRLAVEDPENSEDQIAFEKPDFQGLHENLRGAFDNYLAIRGIRASTVNFLHEYMISKSSREAVMRLKILKKFVEA